MKKLFFVLAVTMLIASGCAGKTIVIPRASMPDWASNVVVHKHYWVSKDFQYAFGAASVPEWVRWSEAEEKAKSSLLAGLKIGTKINDIGIYRTWEDPGTGERYVLVRMDTALVPREKPRKK